MTEPDNALLWARERALEYVPVMRDDVVNGLLDHDFGIAELADGYRAGAAASADRIKELEARVAELTEEVEDLRATNRALALPEGYVLISSFDWSEAAEAKDD